MQLRAFEYSKKKSQHLDPPVKGAPKRITLVSKNFSETICQIFHEIFRVLGVIPKIPSAKYGGNLTTQFLGRVVNLKHPNDVRR